MAGKLSPTAQQRLALLATFITPIGRLHSLVEQYAAARTESETLSSTIRREAQRLKLKLMGVGLDTMSQTCSMIETVAARRLQPAQKARTMRESIANLKHQLDVEQRIVVRDDNEAQAKKPAE